MASNIDIRKVVHALGESKAINLDLSLREIVDSPATDVINSVAHLDPWDLICYTWVTLIRRQGGPEDFGQLGGRGGIKGQGG